MQLVKRIIESFPMNTQISLSGNVLTFNLRAGSDDSQAKVADLASIVASCSQDHGCIAIGERDGEVFSVETTALSISQRLTPTANQRPSGRSDSPLAIYHSQGGVGYPALFVLTPFKGCQLNDCTLYFMDSAGETTYEATEMSPSLTVGNVSISVDGQTLQAQSVGTLFEFFSDWIPVDLQGADTAISGQIATFTVSAGENTEVFLESTAGVLNRSRAKNGDTVVLDTSGIPAGESIRIKAGYKFWPGKTDKVIALI